VAVIVIGDNRAIPICHSYADRPVGSLLALFDSHERIEIAVNQGNAAAELGAADGMPVCLILR
jgi:S-adenosylmethionine hydrolase